MHQIKWSTAVALLVGVFAASPVFAQKHRTETVTTPSVLLDAPRGDGNVLGDVPPGSPIEILDKFENWYLVNAPASKSGTILWQRGWIQADAIQKPGGWKARNSGRLMVRGFGHGGGMLFSASDSFKAIFGRSVNSIYGAGAQVVLPSGIFVQGSIDQFRHTGTRALVSGSQVFTVDVPNRVTLTPLQVTVGYRDYNLPKVATYAGGGVGWHRFQEESPTVPGADSFTQRKMGYHVLAGAEVPVARWVWVAGEVQWATVPKGLGETGVSAVFGEDDLGGTTFRVKFLIGR